jgi:hypothetical protein
VIRNADQKECAQVVPMTTRTDGQPSGSLQRLSDKVSAQKLVKAMLDGADLDIKPLKYELVITNPRDKDKGSVRIEYATGHVTWRRVVRDHWGPLQGYTEDEENALPQVTAERILATLGVSYQPGEPGS